MANEISKIKDAAGVEHEILPAAHSHVSDSWFTGALASKANSADVTTALASKANASTTLSGYGINDAYTKTEVDNKVVGVFHFAGTGTSISSDFTTITKSDSTTVVASSSNNGDVYQIGDIEYASNGSIWVELGSSHDEKINAAMPIGSVIMWTSDTPPNGGAKWKLCQGQALSRTEYSELWNILGVTFGSGDGTTTFNLPDMRRIFPLGAQSGTWNVGTSDCPINVNTSLASKDGEGSHTLTTQEMPSHSHEYDQWDIEGTNMNIEAGDHKFGTLGNTHTTGGSEPHNNIPPYMAINFIIRCK